MRTSVIRHIDEVRNNGRTSEIRIVELWRDQNGLDFPSFPLELTVIAALASARADLSANVLIVFHYLRDDFANARMVDPSNADNIVFR